MGVTLGLHIGLTLGVDGDCRNIVLGTGVSFHGNDRTLVAALTSDDTTGGNDTGICNHTDFATHHNLTVVLVSRNEIGVFPQGGHLMGVDEHNLFGVQFLVELVDSTDNTSIADSTLCIVGILGIQQSRNAITLNLATDRGSQLGGSLSNGIAIAGQSSLIGNVNTLCGLLDGVLHSLGSQQSSLNFSTFGNIDGIANVVVTGYGDSATGLTGQGVVNLCKRGHNDSISDLCGNHIRHNFGVNQICQLSNCHFSFSF